MKIYYARFVRCLLVLILTSTRSLATTILFDQPHITPLPYSEGGLTFEVLPANGPEQPWVSNVLFFSGSGGSTPYHVRASSATPFDLVSFDAESAKPYFIWRIETSAGGIKEFSNLPSTPALTLDFTGTPGFTNISYFDIIHDYGQDRRSLFVDNVVILQVPEPATCTFLVSIFAVGSTQCRRQRVH